MIAKKTTTPATTVDEVRAEMLPDASAAADDAEVADAMEAAGITVAKAARPASKAPAKTAPAPAKPKAPTKAEKAAQAAAEKAEREAAAKAEAYAAKAAAHLAAAQAAFTAEDEPTVSVWVGYFIAAEAIAAGGTLGAKLAAKRPNKVWDRTVQLTRDECEALAAIATAVENEWQGVKGAGPTAYSARTLVARLEFAWA